MSIQSVADNSIAHTAAAITAVASQRRISGAGSTRISHHLSVAREQHHHDEYRNGDGTVDNGAPEERLDESIGLKVRATPERRERDYGVEPSRLTQLTISPRRHRKVSATAYAAEPARTGTASIPVPIMPRLNR